MIYFYNFTISGPNTTENQQIPPLYECQYDGRTYKEGQVIYPDDAPCKKCICQNGFNGKHKFWVEIMKSTFLMQTSSPMDLMLLYLIWSMHICNALTKCNLANGLTSRTWAQIFMWLCHTIVGNHTACNCYIHT